MHLLTSQLLWFDKGETDAAETKARVKSIKEKQMQQQQPVATDEHTEKAFHKQPKVFLSSKKFGKGMRHGKGGHRFWKNIGLGFRTPRDAIEGRILAGTCHITTTTTSSLTENKALSQRMQNLIH